MELKAIQHIFYKTLDTIYGRDEVNSFFFLATEHYLDFPRFQLALQPNFTLSKDETDLFFRLLDDLKQQKPIQYILGVTEFYGLPFKVNDQVLIPRPETEELVDLIIKSFTKSAVGEPINILDIGTGSGCIAISLAKNIPNARVYALDVSRNALETARQNAVLNAVDVTFIEADILETKASTRLADIVALEESVVFDIIVSNPPYVRHLEKQEMQPNVLENEPHLALFVDDLNPLIFYKAITNLAVNNLKQNGELYFEINQYLAKDTKQLLVNANFNSVVLLKDLNGNDRILKGIRK